MVVGGVVVGEPFVMYFVFSFVCVGFVGCCVFLWGFGGLWGLWWSKGEVMQSLLR